MGLYIGLPVIFLVAYIIVQKMVIQPRRWRNEQSIPYSVRQLNYRKASQNLREIEYAKELGL